MRKTTITISKELQANLKKKKMDSKDTYEGVIWDLLENEMELSPSTKRRIAKSVVEYKAGKFYTLEEVKKEFKLK